MLIFIDLRVWVCACRDITVPPVSQQTAIFMEDIENYTDFKKKSLITHTVFKTIVLITFYSKLSVSFWEYILPNTFISLTVSIHVEHFL